MLNVDRAGFEPATSALRSCCNNGIDCGESEDKRVDWKSFKEWLESKYRSRTAHDYLRYSRSYCQCLLNRDFSELLMLREGKRAHIMKGLSALSKFLGMHEEFLKLIKNYGFKWSIRSDDLIIARFTKTEDPNQVFNWIKEVKAAYAELNEFMNLMAATGLRYGEAIESYNLIIRLAKEGKLKEYYDSEREILEHYKFKDLFIRRTKKAFMSFVSKNLVEKISDHEQLNIYGVQTKVKRHTGRLRFGDIREIHGTLSTRHLSESEINFLHGRISSSVFMRNYFNPALIADLKTRAFQGIQEIQAKI